MSNPNDMAEVCELAHDRTVAECKKLGIKVDEFSEENETKYTDEAQDIFNRHYDEIIEATGL